MPVDSRTGAELEARLEADPDDTESYLVYADWLEAQGDPRGRLISYQHELERLEEFQSKTRQVLDENKEELLGPFDVPAVELEWHLGFIRRLSLKVGADGITGSHLDLYEEMLRHPSTRYLRRLEVESPRALSYQALSFEPMDEALGRETPPVLDEILLGERQVSGHGPEGVLLGNLEPFFSRRRRLKKVAILGRAHLGPLDLPECEELDLMSAAMEPAMLHSVRDAMWPSLERLRISFGAAVYDTAGELSDWSSLLDATATPRLEHLALLHGPQPFEIVDALAQSPLLQQLKSLTLSWGTLDPPAAELLIRHRDAFAHLRELDVRSNSLPPEVYDAIREITERVQAPESRSEGPGLSCSFCGLSQQEVSRLIAGPSVYICDQCIHLCSDIIAEDEYAV